MVTDINDNNIRNCLRDVGIWESDTTKFVLERFHGGTFLDVGAHWGYYSLLLAKQVDRVYSLEGNPWTFNYLAENIRLNDFFGRVTALNVAAWDKRTRIKTTKPEGNTGGYRLEEDVVGNTLALRLDDLFNPLEVKYIKVDCEGSDSLVLRGAEHILTEGNPELLIESPPTEYLAHLGYVSEFSTNNGGQGPVSFWRKNTK